MQECPPEVSTVAFRLTANLFSKMYRALVSLRRKRRGKVTDSGEEQREEEGAWIRCTVGGSSVAMTPATTFKSSLSYKLPCLYYKLIAVAE